MCQIQKKVSNNLYFSEIVYRNVRKPNLPATADIAYCEIRIAELMAELEAQKEHSFKL